ncbi:hypothetical protein P5673_008574 [Acropora cervicornis]|uniref:Uncharacterized protein n=1 Tax=Acropora cervicornis TaxID=6130 RepID=A0AAD9QUP0_ACRCE|nr:hypothetical protein P5673_008574 [Acropora cervicornis]
MAAKVERCDFDMDITRTLQYSGAHPFPPDRNFVLYRLHWTNKSDQHQKRLNELKLLRNRKVDNVALAHQTTSAVTAQVRPRTSDTKAKEEPDHLCDAKISQAGMFLFLQWSRKEVLEQECSWVKDSDRNNSNHPESHEEVDSYFLSDSGGSEADEEGESYAFRVTDAHFVGDVSQTEEI